MEAAGHVPGLVFAAEVVRSRAALLPLLSRLAARKLRPKSAVRNLKSILLHPPERLHQLCHLRPAFGDFLVPSKLELPLVKFQPG